MGFSKSLNWRKSNEIQKKPYYLCFIQYHNRKLAIKIFVEKFAKQPAEIFVEKRFLWLDQFWRNRYQVAYLITP
jgi:hypothetical protein